MKLRIFNLLALLFCIIPTVVSIDQMTVMIDATSTDMIEVRNFEQGKQLFTNRTNAAINTIPVGFEGYKMLSSGGGTEITGTIKAAADGQIYIAARYTESFEGWTKLTGYDFTYASTNSLMSIFYKDVQKNEIVTIPVNTDFRGVTPIAKNIIWLNQEELIPDSMQVTFQTKDNFQKSVLTNGALYFLNRNYTIYGVPEEFLNYEFLLANAGVANDGTANSGTYIPSADGEIYLIGRSGVAVTGWTAIPGTEFYYDAGSSIGALSMFKKSVFAGDKVEIPFVDNFQELRPLAKTIVLEKIIPADSMSVTFEIAEDDNGSFLKSTFDENAILFTNRTYEIYGIPTSFKGYDFLASEGAKVDRGVIIPSSSGFVYVIAKSGGLNGWQEVENSQFSYNVTQPTQMSIYRKQVNAGERIELPLVDNFQGVTPIAKEINLTLLPKVKDARLESIKVDGENIPGFMSETQEYEIMLPYNYNQIPLIESIAKIPGATVTIQSVEDPRGTEEERTAYISVKSTDASYTKKYTVQFKVLPPLDLFLCIGQSNMAGYAPLDEIKGDLLPVDNAYLFNNVNKFEQAVNPLNRYSTVVASSSKALLGPSYSFAKSITMRSDKPVGIIVNARGGSSIENWTKGGTGSEKDTLYQPTIERALEAKKWGTFKGIIWHQGEANKSEASLYPGKLKQFVADLRADLNDPDLLFVAGQIGTFGLNVTDFNQMIDTISSFIENADCASSEGLTNIEGDNNHFDRDGALELGERYARIVSDRLYLPDQVVVKIETDAGIFTKKILSSQVELFMNRPAYIITNETFSGFDNFEFLSSNAGETEKGVMIPETDGRLYIIADKGLSIAGWTQMFGADIYYTGAELSVYYKQVSAGDRIPIPEISNFKGITPVAKNINLIEILPARDARIDSVFLDGKYLNGFDKNILTYNYYLPYSAINGPEITVKTHAEGAVYTVTNAINIESSHTAERISSIQVVSADQTVTLTYNIIFEKLPYMDLFLCIGQSNMAGAAPLDALKGDYDDVEDAYLFNSNGLFEKAKNGMNRYANVLTSTNQYYGLTYQFAKRIVSGTNSKIGLIVNARGGSSIELWDKDGTDPGDTLYTKTIERTLDARKWGRYRAVLWHQGEANRTSVSSYPSQLVKLVNNLRQDIGEPDLLFVAGQIGQWRSDNADFNTMISGISSFVDNSACALSDGLINITNLADDNSHFNRDGLIVLGNRYADVVLEKCYNTSGIDNKSVKLGSAISYNDKLYITCPEEGTLCVVSDVSGKIIFKQKIKDSLLVTMDNKGIYIVSFMHEYDFQNIKVVIH